MILRLGIRDGIFRSKSVILDSESLDVKLIEGVGGGKLLSWGRFVTSRSRRTQGHPGSPLHEWTPGRHNHYLHGTFLG